MKLLLASIVTLMFLSTVTAADRPIPGPDLSTPKNALKSFDRVGTDAHVDRATLFYHADTADEKKVAKAFAAVDLETAKLRRAAAARFDRAAGDAMVHALRDVTAEDIDNSKERIEGDKAYVTGKGFSETLPMVKVNGEWKISLVDALKVMKVDELVQTSEALVDAVAQIEQEIQADKYANPSLLERAVKRQMVKIMGEP